MHKYNSSALDRMFYLLKDGEIKKVDNIIEWGAWYETTKERRIARDTVGCILISTVFLSIDHSFSGKGPPILFETMIFGGKYDGYQTRYISLKNARDGHLRAVVLVNSSFTFFHRLECNLKELYFVKIAKFLNRWYKRIEEYL